MSKKFTIPSLSFFILISLYSPIVLSTVAASLFQQRAMNCNHHGKEQQIEDREADEWKQSEAQALNECHHSQPN